MTDPTGEFADVVLSAERLDTGTEWFSSGRLRVRKQIVAYTQTVELTLHREELVVEFDHVVATSADGLTWAGTSTAGPSIAPPIAQPPYVLLLSEEVPQIDVVTRVYERATTRSVLVTENITTADTVRREQATLDPVQLSQPTGVEPE